MCGQTKQDASPDQLTDAVVGYARTGGGARFINGDSLAPHACRTGGICDIPKLPSCFEHSRKCSIALIPRGSRIVARTGKKRRCQVSIVSCQ